MLTAQFTSCELWSTCDYVHNYSSLYAVIFLVSKTAFIIFHRQLNRCSVCRRNWSTKYRKHSSGYASLCTCNIRCHSLLYAVMFFLVSKTAFIIFHRQLTCNRWSVCRRNWRGKCRKYSSRYSMLVFTCNLGERLWTLWNKNEFIYSLHPQIWQ